MATNLTSLIENTRYIEDCLEFCNRRRLLSDKQICPICKYQCELVNKPDDIDQYACKCQICNTYISVRHRSFFEKSELELSKILRIIYLWAYEMDTLETIVRECRVSSPSVIAEWIAALRTVCTEYFYRNPSQIGGQGHAIEIDECLYARQQSNPDGTPQEPFWVFGGYDPAEKAGFLLSLPDQDPHTMMLMIKKYILPGTTLMLDPQDALDRLGEEGYKELTVDHLINFVDPDSKSITNLPGIRMWKEAKMRNKNECGLKNSLVDTYLTEYMWRQKFRSNYFDIIIDQIACIYNFEQPGPPMYFIKQEPEKFEEPDSPVPEETIDTS